MSLNIAAGYGAQYGAGGTSRFIPEIWSGRLAVKFYKSTCLSEITNNDWEGEIKDMGEKVIIRTIPTISINDYTKGLNLSNQVPTSTPIELNIDKGKYFAVVLDDVDAVQADLSLMNMFTDDAAEQMKIAIETQVFGSIYLDAATGNKGATAGIESGTLNLGTEAAPRSISSTTVLDAILDAGQALDEQNVPENGRWIVIPPFMASLIKRSEFRQTYLTGDDTSIARNGKLGQIDRFTIYVSNNLAKVGTGATAKYHVMAGTNDATSWASQIAKVETIRSTATFGDIVRGLNVYGFKVTKPEALIDLVVAKA